MENKHSREGLMGVGVRVVAIVAFLAIAVIGMIGSVKVASAIPNAFSSLAAAVVSITSIFVPANEQIILSVPSLTVSSGEAVTVSWEHAKKSTEGSYTFRYDCADSVYLESPAASGASTMVYCNVPFNFLNSANSISLTPFSNANRYIDVKLYVDFTPNGTSKPTVTGSTTLTIVNGSVSGSPAVTGSTAPQPAPIQNAAPAPKPVTQVKGQETTVVIPVSGTTSPIIAVSNPNGYVDLTARVLEIGVVDKTSGVFTASSSPMRNPPGGRIAVRFAVENVGTKISPQFDFTAVLPTFPSYVFTSPMQQALSPGDRIEFTLGFDTFDQSGKGIFVVNVDPASRVNEKNKDNNLLHYDISVTN
jgi:hypothetical protein